jgi:hypothetical protein
MSPMAASWLSFALGVIPWLAWVWLHRGQGRAWRTKTRLRPGVLGSIMIVIGCSFALEGLAEYHGRAHWWAMGLGLLLGGALGVASGRRWISGYVLKGEVQPPSRITRLLRSWVFRALVITLLTVIAMQPSFHPAFLSYSNAMGGVSQALAGMFLAFGLYLGLSR